MKFVASSVLSVILLSLMCSVSSSAQKLTFGYLSYDKILHGMADYVVAQERIKNIHEQYDKEAEYNEDKFFKMYAEYIQGQKTFPEEIMLKRQKELQVAMEQGISFRKDAEKLLRDTEAELLKPLKEKLNSAIAVVAKERKLALALMCLPVLSFHTPPSIGAWALVDNRQERFIINSNVNNLFISCVLLS